MLTKCVKIKHLCYKTSTTQTFALDLERPTATAIFYGFWASWVIYDLFEACIDLKESRCPHMVRNKVRRYPDKCDMSRWFRKYRRKKDMTTNNIGKNILSDPTSDGNFSTTDDNGPTERPSSPVYSYEEFDRGVNHVNSQCTGADPSLTQTCPTCGGTGKLTKGTAHFMPGTFNYDQCVMASEKSSSEPVLF